MTPRQAGDRESRSQKVYKRAYIACILCRKRKIRCEVSDDLDSCVRCQREREQCIFTETRKTASRLEESSPTQQKSKTSHRSARRPQSSGQHTWKLRNSLGDDATASSASPIDRPIHDTSVISPKRSRSRNRSRLHLQAELMNTEVVSSQDARDLLFKAAAERESQEALSDCDSRIGDYGNEAGANRPSSKSESPMYPSELLELWEQSHYVRQGWMSAREALQYLELFFVNISPLTSITNPYFSHHENHKELLDRELLLCSTYLMISSRYHTLSRPGAAIRSYYVHDCLWRHVEHMIQSLTFGSDVKSGPRTLGCVRALLLLTEWHPRALQFSAGPTSSNSRNTPTSKTVEETRWQEEVFEPAKRADRMSWMMLGLANSLLHELEVYDETKMKLSTYNALERQRIRRLVCLHVNQLALTLGCTSFIPFESGNTLLSTSTLDTINVEGEKITSLSIDLTSLSKMAKSVAISSRSRHGEKVYTSLFDDFKPLLNQWFQRFQEFQPVAIAAASVDLLFLEYQYVRMYVGSVGIQALVEGMSKDFNDLAPRTTHAYSGSSTVLAEEVIDAASSMLSQTISLARIKVLRYCPARTFWRIMSACIFLLKALGLKVSEAQTLDSLRILDECLEMLAAEGSGDDRPWDRYAVLIKRYAYQFRRRGGPATASSSTVFDPNHVPASWIPANDSRQSAQRSQNFTEFDEFCQAFGAADGHIDDLLIDQWDFDTVTFDSGTFATCTQSAFPDLL